MRDLHLNHLRLLLLMASIASAMLLPAWALYDLRRIVLVLEKVSVFFLWKYCKLYPYNYFLLRTLGFETILPFLVSIPQLS